MDIDRVVQKVRDRMSSPQKVSPKPPASPNVPTPPKIPQGSNPRNSPKSVVERASPRSPQMENRIPVKEVRDVTYEPGPAENKVSASISYDVLRKSTREHVEETLKSMDSTQLRMEILKLRSERSSVRSQRVHPSDKVPVYDHETGAWVLYPRHMLSQRQSFREPTQEPTREPQRYPQNYKRGTTRDAYPTRTNVPTYNPQQTEVTALNPDAVDEVIDIDFDSMTDVQKREFLDEMKMKFAVIKKNYPGFPVPVVHEDDNPKWVYGVYEQLLDMAKGDASQPVYQTGLQIVFLILQVGLTLAGVPAKNFFSFHAKHFHKYNTLMVELGEKWGPIIDVTSSIETKLAISIGWNTIIFAVVSVIASRFGDKWGTNVEQLLEKITTTDSFNTPTMQNLEAELNGREKLPSDAPQAAGGPDMMQGISNLLSSFMGGGGGDGGGLGNILGGLLGAMGGQKGSAESTVRNPPMYDD